MLERRTSPVFVLGCHRSGTNLMYDTLMSSGGFAVQRNPLYVYGKLLPRFGSFSRRKNRERMMDVWMRSKAFRSSGLDATRIRSMILNDCQSAGDFLRIVMGQIARLQNRQRWAIWGPDNVLHIPQIKRDIPDASFLHVIRDGRDVALALTKMRFLRQFPWDRNKAALACALFWQWMVRRGRWNGRMFPRDYMEVHYEDLVTCPQATLALIAEFIGRELDYDRICTVRLGTLAEPNSTFKTELEHGDFQPIGRWKKYLSEREVWEIECLTGECLEQFGYP